MIDVIHTQVGPREPEMESTSTEKHAESLGCAWFTFKGQAGQAAAVVARRCARTRGV